MPTTEHTTEHTTQHTTEHTTQQTTELAAGASGYAGSPHDVDRVDLWAETGSAASAPTAVMPAVDRPTEPSIETRPNERSTVAFVIAGLATLLLAGAALFGLLRSNGSETAVAGTAAASGATIPVPESAVTPSTVPGEVPPSEQAVTSVVPAPAPLPAVPSPDQVDGPDGPAPVAPPPAPAPVGPVATVPPAPQPPAPSAALSVQDTYELDPGVLGVTVTLQNSGDAAMQYEINNDGDGFSADAPTGEVASGAGVDVWIQLDVVAEGDGPTPFERVIAVESNGGAAQITVTGQVEKPGFLVADFQSMPLVDYRATVSFTNVGGLALDLVTIDAPGLRLGMLPDSIAAGETLEIDVAICADGPPLPVSVPLPNPNPQIPILSFQLGSWVTVETDVNTVSTALNGITVGFDPPSCQPVIGQVTDELVFAP